MAHKESPDDPGVNIPATGATLFISKACSGCHRENSSNICPSLTNFAQKPLIAGKIPNTRENLRKWLKKPSSIKKGTSMPNLGLADEEIELLIEYIYTL